MLDSVRLQFPPLYWHVISWQSSGAAADRHTIYDRAKQPDRSSGSHHPRTKTVYQRVSQHHMTRPQAPRHAEETSATKSNRRSPRPHDGRTKKQRKCGSTHYVALPHTAFTGVTKLTHTPPTLLACFYFELGWINRIAGHIRKNTNDQIWQWPISAPRKLYLASHTVDKTTGLPYGCARKLRTINNGQTTTSQPPRCMSTTTRTGTSPWRPKTS